MKHILKLQPRYYESMKNGVKQIELRLFDEKRKNIINSYKKNSSKEVANNIYEDLLKEDDKNEDTK